MTPMSGFEADFMMPAPSSNVAIRVNNCPPQMQAVSSQILRSVCGWSFYILDLNPQYGRMRCETPLLKVSLVKTFTAVFVPSTT